MLNSIGVLLSDWPIFEQSVKKSGARSLAQNKTKKKKRRKS